MTHTLLECREYVGGIVFFFDVFLFLTLYFCLLDSWYSQDGGNLCPRERDSHEGCLARLGGPHGEG